MSTLVKICGLSTAETVDATVEASADMVGFNFFPTSPRYVAPDAAGALAARVPEHVVTVALFVEPDDDLLASVIDAGPMRMIQLHGHETPERTAEVRERFGLPVMKVLGIAARDDLAQADAYAGVADRLLLDTKPPKGADRPGGNAVAFDWTVLDGWEAPLPWLLAGGLTVDNVAEAIRISGAGGVDLSSGVESAPGVKDTAKIRAFIAAAKGQ